MKRGRMEKRFWRTGVLRSESLSKWIWVDPTFAAYVTDENGLLLHPGEVRYRLQNDLPLYLNEDANWNNRSIQKKEYYLDEYMAKNLYIMSANAQVITTDDEWFWQAPKKE